MSNQSNRGTWKKDPADRGLSQRGHVWYIRYTDQNGELHTEAIGPSKPFARKVLERRRSEVREGRLFPELARRSTSFTEIVQDALEQSQKQHSLKYAGARRFRDYR